MWCLRPTCSSSFHEKLEHVNVSPKCLSISVKGNRARIHDPLLPGQTWCMRAMPWVRHYLKLWTTRNISQTIYWLISSIPSNDPITTFTLRTDMLHLIKFFCVVSRSPLVDGYSDGRSGDKAPGWLATAEKWSCGVTDGTIESMRCFCGLSLMSYYFSLHFDIHSPKYHCRLLSFSSLRFSSVFSLFRVYSSWLRALLTLIVAYTLLSI